MGPTLPFPTIIATYIKNPEEQAVVDQEVAAHCTKITIPCNFALCYFDSQDGDRCA